MNYQEAIDWLYGTQLFGIKLGLDNSRRLFEAWGLPGKEQRIVHVAGTNGKGSVCAMIASMSGAAGSRTGLFTSPHLISFCERARVNGKMIPETEAARLIGEVRELVADWDPHPTFFELTTTLALRYFAEQACDVIVLETGMGGRLDATNVVVPAVSVITPIAMDHEKSLGESLAEIAAEKAGIMKAGVPVVSAAQDEAAETVLRARAEELGTTIEFVARGEELKTVPLRLPGRHQRENAALAARAFARLALPLGEPPEGSIHGAPAQTNRNHESAIERGLAEVTWPGRFQRVGDRAVLDGAHNPEAAARLRETWRESFGEGQKATVIFGVAMSKDAAGCLREVAPIASEFVFTGIKAKRGVAPEELRELLRGIAPGTPSRCVPALEDALSLIERSSHPTLVTGSLFLVGEALSLLEPSATAFECSEQ